jgi:hypothetical protein
MHKRRSSSRMHRLLQVRVVNNNNNTDGIRLWVIGSKRKPEIRQWLQQQIQHMATNAQQWTHRDQWKFCRLLCRYPCETLSVDVKRLDCAPLTMVTINQWRNLVGWLWSRICMYKLCYFSRPYSNMHHNSFHDNRLSLLLEHYVLSAIEREKTCSTEKEQ